MNIYAFCLLAFVVCPLFSSSLGYKAFKSMSDIKMVALRQRIAFRAGLKFNILLWVSLCIINEAIDIMIAL